MRGEKHGHTRGRKFSPTYQSWATMLVRCNNKKSMHYGRYGGRGIKVCDRWHSFSSFLEDMGERPEGTTLDRIDTDGWYEPANCRWADKITQSRNRSSVVWVEIDGDRKRLVEWVKVLGVSINTVRARVKFQGMTYQQALLEPTVRPNGKKASGPKATQTKEPS